MKTKRRRNRCYHLQQNHHAKIKKWEDYYFSYVDHKGVEIYNCIKCRDFNNKEIERLNRIVANEKNQKEDQHRIFREKSEARIAKRLIQIKEQLWDHYVEKELYKGDSVKIEFPKEMIQLKRATMRLQRMIKACSHLPCNMPSNNILRCRIHGQLSDQNIILVKPKVYKCKLCMKEIINIYCSDKTQIEIKNEIKEKINDKNN